MINAVLFDFDGVIAKTEPVHKQTFIEIFKQHGLDISISDERWYREFAGTGSGKIFAKLTIDYKLNANIEEMVKQRQDMFLDHVKKGNVELVPGAKELIMKLHKKGVKMAIVSGGHRDYIELLLEMNGLTNFFPVIVSANDIKARKPDPEPFLYAARKLGVPASECVVLEDSYSGCEAAKKAGMKLIWVRPNKSMKPPECDLVVDDLTDCGSLLYVPLVDFVS